MRKTLAFFVLAFSLLMTALIIGIQRPKPTVPTPDPIPDQPKLITEQSGHASLTLGEVVVLDAKLSNEFVLANREGALSPRDRLRAEDQRPYPPPSDRADRRSQRPLRWHQPGQRRRASPPPDHIGVTSALR